MKLKKYYADNMQDAMRIIKDDIGSDAVILSSKMIRSKKGLFGLFSKKRIEVVAGFEEKAKQPAQEANFRPYLKYSAEDRPEKQSVKAAAKPPVQPIPTAPYEGVDVRISEQSLNQSLELNLKEEEGGDLKKIEGLDVSISELKKLINGLTSRVENYSGAQETKFSREVRELFDKLVDNDVDRSLATDLCFKTEGVIANRDADPAEVLGIFIKDLIGEVKPIQCTRFKRKVVMIIGPTGVGKTTTLVKLASKFLCEDKLDVGVINADVFRVAAKEHLKAYCDILSMDMLTIYRPAEIVEALQAFKPKDIVFIDTAGKLSSNKQYQEEIGELVRLGEVDEIYLLVSASTSEKVIQSIVQNYSFLKNHNIIVTKVDESPTMGVICNIARDSGRPLSYMTTGQSVPDDIVEMDPDEIVKSILENPLA